MTFSTNTSRRAVLAAIPAVAAAAAPAAATALSGLPTAMADERVFAAIEAHRRAKEVHERCETRWTALCREFDEKRDPRGIYLGEFPVIKRLVEMVGDVRTFEDVEIPIGRTEPIFTTIPGMIDYVAEQHRCTDSWKAEKRHEWEQWSGITETDTPRDWAYDAWNDAGRVLARATAALNVRPTTPAGVVALLRYVADTYSAEDDSPWTDTDGLLQDVLHTLADAVQARAVASGEVRS